MPVILGQSLRLMERHLCQTNDLSANSSRRRHKLHGQHLQGLVSLLFCLLHGHPPGGYTGLQVAFGLSPQQLLPVIMPITQC